MPKKIARDIARQVRDLSEEVIKEGIKQPVELLKTAGEQLGVLPKAWGENLEPKISERDIKQREEKRKKELAFWQQRQRELTARPKVEPEITQEEIEERKKQKKLAQEAEKRKPLEEPQTKKPRGLFFGAQQRIEKAQPERAAGRSHSG